MSYRPTRQVVVLLVDSVNDSNTFPATRFLNGGCRSSARAHERAHGRGWETTNSYAVRLPPPTF